MGWKTKMEQHFRKIAGEAASFSRKDKEIIDGNREKGKQKTENCGKTTGRIRGLSKVRAGKSEKLTNYIWKYWYIDG